MNVYLFKRSGRLFANPSFIEGMGRVFDILGDQDVYNQDQTGDEADSNALFSDWAAVGDHIVSAAKEIDSNVSRQ